jgi:Protein of unknown function (DUF3761)
MLTPGQSDKPPSTFWQRLYSTPSLLFLATLTVAIWASFFSSLYPSHSQPKYGDFSAVLASPSPTPQLSCVELYLRRRDSEFLQNCGIVERMGIYRRQPNMVRFIIAAAGHPTEEARLLSLQVYRNVRESAEEILGITSSPTPGKYADFDEALSATARCKDGTFSHSATRRDACSHHGGVAQWLSR